MQIEDGDNQATLFTILYCIYSFGNEARPYTWADTMSCFGQEVMPWHKIHRTRSEFRPEVALSFALFSWKSAAALFRNRD